MSYYLGSLFNNYETISILCKRFYKRFGVKIDTKLLRKASI